MRLVAGHFPAAPPAPTGLQVPLPPPVLRQRQPAVLPADAGRGDEADGGHVRPAGRLEVQVTSPLSLAANGGLVTFQVSGIVTPVDPGSSFWTADADPGHPHAGKPGEHQPAAGLGRRRDRGPGRGGRRADGLRPGGLTMQWGFPLDARLGHRAAGAAAQRHADLAQRPDAAAVRRRRARWRPRWASPPGLLPTLAAYFATAQSVDALLWLLWVSLTVTGVVVLLLAARMVAMRRSAEFAVVRARGASLWQAGAGRRAHGGGRLRSRGRDRRRARHPRGPRPWCPGRGVRGRLVAAGRHPRRRDLRPGRDRGLAAPAAAPPHVPAAAAAGSRGPGCAWSPRSPWWPRRWPASWCSASRAPRRAPASTCTRAPPRCSWPSPR